MNFFLPRALVATAILSATTIHAAEETKGPVRVPVQEPKPATLAAPETADAIELQGKWEGVEIGQEGLCTLTVTGKTMHFQGGKKGEWYKATFTLPPNTDPKQLKGTITDCPRPEMVGLAAPAIYKLEQGKLTLAGRRPGTTAAPKSFEPEPDTRIFEFKRAAETAK